MDQTTLIVIYAVSAVVGFAALYYVVYNAVRNAIKDSKGL